jgi:hypothetical protein
MITDTSSFYSSNKHTINTRCSSSNNSTPFSISKPCSNTVSICTVSNNNSCPMRSLRACSTIKPAALYRARSSADTNNIRYSRLRAKKCSRSRQGGSKDEKPIHLYLYVDTIPREQKKNYQTLLFLKYECRTVCRTASLLFGLTRERTASADQFLSDLSKQ